MKHHFSSFLQRVAPFFLLFMGFESLLRLIFTAKEWAELGRPMEIIAGLLIGAMFDLAAFAYFLIPLALYFWLLPARLHNTRADRIASGVLFGVFTFILLFTSVSEWFFWDEFAARFNFIAVDYLVYTHEVIGNIRESYPIVPLITAMALVSLAAGFAFSRRGQPAAQQPHTRAARQRGALALATAGVALASFVCVQGNWTDILTNRFQHEISKNGLFELFSAYRQNELDYARFYTMGDEKQTLALLRQQIGHRFEDAALTRRITADAPEQRKNIVLITVESLSGDYLGALGNTEGLTPHLDKLASESLFFTNFYAIGTRTVYGLSAITLSIPPLPGNAIVRRPGNENLFTLGSVLNSKGYKSQFVYGGYGYFDNMNSFFANNGYAIVDRTLLAKDEITFANIWGVADEDLFRRTLKENDASYAAGQPFFNMIMTTSNHRPFTYPDGRIDIPSHTGRKGGVKYTDYAIGRFIAEAREKPWFKNTVFVIVADHTAGGAGKSELDPKAYHIPLIIYAPGFIKPQKVSTMASQIDLAPTLLGLLHMDYTSRFYGKDILREPPNRALISNYQQLGYLTENSLTVLKPVKQIQTFHRAGEEFVPDEHANETAKSLALSYFQNATHWREWNKALQE